SRRQSQIFAILTRSERRVHSASHSFAPRQGREFAVSEPTVNSVASCSGTTGNASQTAAAFRPTSTRYIFLDEIARGGMGIVFRATDAVLDREVAVKVLLEIYGPESDTARRFRD